jgi:hypothetical protein
MMDLTRSRWKELEEQWERNRRKRAGVRGFIVQVPPDMTDMRRLLRDRQQKGHQKLETVLDRPERLRGSDLVQELARLALEWGDRRFAQCVRALFELGIIDERSHAFTKKRGQHAASLTDKQEEDAAVAKVQSLRSNDPILSERLACAMAAADFVEADNFEKAVDRVRNAWKMDKRARGQVSTG